MEFRTPLGHLMEFFGSFLATVAFVLLSWGYSN